MKVKEWEGLEKKYEDGDIEVRNLIKKYRTIQKEIEQLKRLQFTAPKLAKRESLLHGINELQHIPDLPPDVKDQKDRAIDQKLRAQERIKQLLTEKTELQKSIDNLQIPGGLLEQEHTIDHLYKDMNTYKQLLDDLPQIEGEINTVHQEVQNRLNQLHPGAQEMESINHYRISEEKKQAIRFLSEEKKDHDRNKKDVIERLGTRKREWEEEQESFEQFNAIPDLQHLHAIIEQVKPDKHIETEIQKTIYELDNTKQIVFQEMHALPLWNGTMKEVFTLPLPGKETVKRYQQLFFEWRQHLDQINKQLEEEEGRIESNEKEIQTLESLTTIPTEEDLQTAREQRNDIWYRIRKAFRQKELGAEEGIEDDYEVKVKKADHTADKMRQEAEKVGQKSSLVAAIENSKERLQELKDEKTSHFKQYKHLQADLESVWEPCGITPLTPEEMQEWIEQFQWIKQTLQEQRELQNSLYQWNEKKESLYGSLIHVLEDHQSIDQDWSLEVLLATAEKMYELLYSQKQDKEQCRKTLEKLKRNQEELIQDQQNLETERQVWQKKWDNTIDGLPFSANNDPNVVVELLAPYDECVKRYGELQSLRRKKIQLLEQKEKIEHDVKQVQDNVELHLSDYPTASIVDQLHQQLEKSKQDQVKRDNYQENRKSLEKEQEKAEQQIEDAEIVLQQLMVQAACDDEVQLDHVISHFLKKKELEQMVKQVEDQLLEHGSGLTIPQLVEEGVQVDVDELQGRLQEKARELEDVDKERSRIEQEHGAVKSEYQNKVEGSSMAAAEAAEQKEAILADLQHYTSEYINIKLASVLLQKGIEQYRQENQNPILERASGFFQRLTLGSFESLSVDYNEDYEPVLTGIRNQNERVLVSGMSDGTTDQLYLALRLASLEQFNYHNEPIPFIVDDILIHFDDDRAKETLRILIELSEHNQVLFFTHHEHLKKLLEENEEEQYYEIKHIHPIDSSVSAK